MAGERKYWFLLIAGSILLLAEAAINLLLSPPASPQTVSKGALVVSRVGQVEWRRSGSDSWQPLSLGARLSEGNEIRTGQFSEAGLLVSGASTITVGANTNFVIGSEIASSVSFELGTGQVDASIKEQQDRRYLFRSQESDALASTNQGEFQLSSDGRGLVVLDTRQGEVELSAAGKSVRLTRGQRSTVKPGAPPSEAAAIPASITLQVRWPPAKLDRTQVQVAGKTTAGSSVTINGIVIRADAEGNFVAEVPLREGSNKLVVSATDNAGNTMIKESGELQVSTRPPRIEIDAKDLWK